MRISSCCAVCSRGHDTFSALICGGKTYHTPGALTANLARRRHVAGRARPPGLISRRYTLRRRSSRGHGFRRALPNLGTTGRTRLPASPADRMRAFRKRQKLIAASRDAWRYDMERRLLKIEAYLESSRYDDRYVTQRNVTPPTPPSIKNLPSEDKESLKKDSPRLPSGVFPPKRGANGKALKNESGSRISPDWQPSAKDRELARSLGVDPDREGDEFRDYWLAEHGAKSIKRNWDAAFRNRCRWIAKNGGQPRLNGGYQPRGGGLVESIRLALGTQNLDRRSGDHRPRGED